MRAALGAPRRGWKERLDFNLNGRASERGCWWPSWLRLKLLPSQRFRPRCDFTSREVLKRLTDCWAEHGWELRKGEMFQERQTSATLEL